MSDRKEFQSARDAGLKQRHEQRLARSAHYNEAVKAAAVAIGRAFNGDPLTWRAEAEAAVDAALPHLRAYQAQRLENATYTAVEVKALTKTAADLAYALGRKEALDRESIIDALEAEWLKHSAAKTVDSPRGHCARLADALIAARDIDKGDPA